MSMVALQSIDKADTAWVLVATAMVLMMTSFTRIIIVLSLLRQALGTATTPPNQVLVGLALFLSLFVMAPTLEKVNERAVAPRVPQGA